MVLAVGHAGQGGALLHKWPSLFAETDDAAAEEAKPSGDTLPLDIHVIVKKAAGGTGGVQVSKTATGEGVVAAEGAKHSAAPAWLALGKWPDLRHREQDRAVGRWQESELRGFL
eukprot:TRINITY_DN33873_c0_g1_i1.p1 TRINITY_DN33873_c0_g1~~TRINITY_DN33873_c0_g1_i1.p1  ORF type:complete len:114 (+),score=29.45 TRINITY_DN33873_c0_g1_i1:48-389(+)